MTFTSGDGVTPCLVNQAENDFFSEGVFDIGFGGKGLLNVVGLFKASDGMVNSSSHSSHLTVPFFEHKVRYDNDVSQHLVGEPMVMFFVYGAVQVKYILHLGSGFGFYGLCHVCTIAPHYLSALVTSE